MSGYNPSTPMNTIYCSCCSVQLSYPQGSMYIQCPKCRNTMNPQAPQQTSCINCSTLLAHPPNSLYIQCPKCLVTMNAREVPRNLYQQQLMQQHPMQTKQPKKRKDPNAPKAASNAYMIFCKERRAKLKEEFPDLPFGQLGAKLGQMWRALTPEEKKPYEDKASEDRERYRKDMENYQNGLPEMPGGSGDITLLKKQRVDENGSSSMDLTTDPTQQQQQQPPSQPQQQQQQQQPGVIPGGVEAPNTGSFPHTNPSVAPSTSVPSQLQNTSGSLAPINSNQSIGSFDPSQNIGGVPGASGGSQLTILQTAAGLQQPHHQVPLGPSTQIPMSGVPQDQHTAPIPQQQQHQHHIQMSPPSAQVPQQQQHQPNVQVPQTSISPSDNQFLSNQFGLVQSQPETDTNVQTHATTVQNTGEMKTSHPQVIQQQHIGTAPVQHHETAPIQQHHVSSPPTSSDPTSSSILQQSAPENDNVPSNVPQLTENVEHVQAQSTQSVHELSVGGVPPGGITQQTPNDTFSSSMLSDN